MNKAKGLGLAVLLGLVGGVVPVASNVQAGEEAAVAQGEAVITMRLDGEITVDTLGRVHEYRIDTEMTPGVKALVDKVVPSWRFEPVVVDGKAITAASPMRLVIAAVKQEDGYRIRLDNVIFRPNTKEDYEKVRQSPVARDDVRIKAEKLRPPVYPATFMSAGVEAIVMLNVRVNEDGSVADVFAAQSSLLNVKGRQRDLERARVALEENAANTARQWRFHVEVLDRSKLSPSAMTIRIPVEYTLVRRESEAEDTLFTGTWRHEFRGPLRTTPWLTDNKDEQRVGASDLGGNEMLAGAPTLRLLDRDKVLGIAN